MYKKGINISRVLAYTNMIFIILSSLTLMAQNYKQDISIYQPNSIIDKEADIYDKTLVDIYVRLMRYQTADRHLKNVEYGEKASPNKYLSIAINKIHSDELNLLEKHLASINEKFPKEILKLTRNEYCKEIYDCYLSYSVDWASRANYAKLTLERNNIISYNLYDITIKYYDETRTGQGIIIYYNSADSDGNKYIIYDNIIPEIRIVANDRLPQAKSPINQYNQKSKYNSSTGIKAMRNISNTKNRQVSMQESDMIGYLIGDENCGLNDARKIMAGKPKCVTGKLNVNNFSKLGDNQTRIRTVINWILNNVNISCAKWLTGNTSNDLNALKQDLQSKLSILLGDVNDTSTQYYAHADLSVCGANLNNPLGAVYGNDDPLPAGLVLITINDNGPFFNSNYMSVGGFTGEKGQVDTLLHEISHHLRDNYGSLNAAKDYKNDWGSQPTVNANENMLKYYCGGVIDNAQGNIP